MKYPLAFYPTMVWAGAMLAGTLVGSVAQAQGVAPEEQPAPVSMPHSSVPFYGSYLDGSWTQAQSSEVGDGESGVEQSAILLNVPELRQEDAERDWRSAIGGITLAELERLSSPYPEQPLPVAPIQSGTISSQAPTSPDQADGGNVQQNVSPAENSDGTFSESQGGQLVVPLFGADQDPNAFSFGFGSLLGEPNALYGPTRRSVSSAAAQRSTIFPVGAHLKKGFGSNQRLLLEALGDSQSFGFDLSYSKAFTHSPGSLSFNFQNQRSQVSAFEEGSREVNLPNGAAPTLHRLGGGIEYFRPLNTHWSTAVGGNFQQVSVRDGIFARDIEPVDELGNALTEATDGRDTLMTLNFSTLYSNLDNSDFPNRGSRIRLGLDQSVPVGEAQILFTRLNGNLSQFIPLFSEQNPHVLVFNAQAGRVFGDVPPYEAYSLGGNRTIRGYMNGQAATGSSFVQTTAEYRSPFKTLTLFNMNFGFRGVAFFDYGTVLGTQNEVTGQPGIVRDKAGHGFGYGLGTHMRTPFGLFRLEGALNDQGDGEIHFFVGDQF